MVKESFLNTSPIIFQVAIMIRDLEDGIFMLINAGTIMEVRSV